MTSTNLITINDSLIINPKYIIAINKIVERRTNTYEYDKIRKEYLNDSEYYITESYFSEFTVMNKNTYEKKTIRCSDFDSIEVTYTLIMKDDNKYILSEDEYKTLKSHLYIF